MIQETMDAGLPDGRCSSQRAREPENNNFGIKSGGLWQRRARLAASLTHLEGSIAEYLAAAVMGKEALHVGANKTYEQKGDRARMLGESDEFRRPRHARLPVIASAPSAMSAACTP